MDSEIEKQENSDLSEYLMFEKIIKNHIEDFFIFYKQYSSLYNNFGHLPHYFIGHSSSIEEQLKKSKERILSLKKLSEQNRHYLYHENEESKEKDFLELSKKIYNIENQLKELVEKNDKLSEILFSDISSYGAHKTYQLIPVNIFLDTNDPNKIYSTYQATLDFLTSIGFETVVDFPEKKGSWIKKIISKSKDIITSEEVSERLKEAEYAVEVNTILKPQSEVEKNQSEALLNILKGLEGIPNAVIRIGSLIVVKVTNQEGEMNVQVRTLSIKELHLLNKHPELLNQPKQILSDLANLIDDSQE